jgi:hypothetical protein
MFDAVLVIVAQQADGNVDRLEVAHDGTEIRLWLGKCGGANRNGGRQS